MGGSPDAGNGISRHARAGRSRWAARSTPARSRRRVPRRRPPSGTAAMITVVLADDQALVRGGFRALLDAQDDISVVGEAADGDEAVATGPSSCGPTSC